MIVDFNVEEGSINRNYITVENGDAIHATTLIALVALPMAEVTMVNKSGTPHVHIDDVPESLHQDPENTQEPITNEFHNSQARWEWVLGEIIFALREHATCQENAPKPVRVAKEGDETAFTVDDVKYAMIPGGADALIAYGERIQRGMQLFGKYYSHIGV